MSQRFLSIRHTQAVVDFMEELVEYTSESKKKTYHDFIEELETRDDVSLSRKADTVKRLAIETWPMRRAMRGFLAHEGAPLEWEALIKAARPATALLLKRLQKQVGIITIDELLKAPEAATALHEAEEIELRLLRPEVRVQLWNEQRTLLELRIQEARRELQMTQMQLERLRETADKAPTSQEALLARIEELEDKFYFGGELLSLEELEVDRVKG